MYCSRQHAGFRPLTGIFVFNYADITGGVKMVKYSFRPLTGIFVFNYLSSTGNEGWFNGFRPLTGIFVFNENGANVKDVSARLFPSPYGDFCF